MSSGRDVLYRFLCVQIGSDVLQSLIFQYPISYVQIWSHKLLPLCTFASVSEITNRFALYVMVLHNKLLPQMKDGSCHTVYLSTSCVVIESWTNGNFGWHEMS